MIYLDLFAMVRLTAWPISVVRWFLLELERWIEGIVWLLEAPRVFR